MQHIKLSCPTSAEKHVLSKKSECVLKHPLTDARKWG